MKKVKVKTITDVGYDFYGNNKTKKSKISQESAQEMLAFLEACLDCETADDLYDFVSNNAEDVADRAYGVKDDKVRL